MTNHSEETIDKEKLLFDVIDYLKRNYDISERQITTNRNMSDYVILKVHNAPEDFPGFQSSAVPVIDMSDEIKWGYHPTSNNIVNFPIKKPTAPDWE